MEINKRTEESNQITAYKICIVEDEETIGREIGYQIAKMLEGEPVEITVIDNFNEANEIIESALLDQLIADIQLPRSKDNRTPVDADELMLRIKEKEFFVPILSHTAFRGKHERMIQSGLCDVSIMKHLDSNKEVIKASTEFANSTLGLRQSFFRGLSYLYESSNNDDVFVKQSLIRKCKAEIGRITLPEFLPGKYQKTLIWLIAFLMRFSSIPSSAYQLIKPEPHLAGLLEPLRIKLESCDFNYQRDAVPVMKSLELNGYPVLMRVDLED